MQLHARILILTCWLVAVGGASAQSPAQPSPQPAIRWKFTRGQTLRYQAIAEVDTRRVEGELTYPFDESTTTIDIRWYVEEVDPDGTATITETIERVQQSTTGSKGTRELDSKKSRKGMAILAGLKFSFRMSPHGHPSEVTLPSRLEKALDARGGGELSDWFGKTALHYMPSFPMPTDDSCRRQSWSKETELALPSLCTMRYTRTFDFADEQLRDGHTIDEFRFTSTSQIVEDPRSAVKFVLDKFAGKGTYQFDTTAGRILAATEQSRFDGTMTVGIIGRHLRNRTKTTWRLLPGPGEPGHVAVPENK